MNWDQIENNWAAMTRRVRPERPATTVRSPDAVQPSGDMAEITGDAPERPVVQAVAASRQIA